MDEIKQPYYSPTKADTGSLMRLRKISELAICTKPLARQTLRMRYFRHYGLPQRHESLFAFRL